MARHTYPLRRADDLAFPIRIKVVVPGMGFGGLLDEMTAWLNESAPGRSAHHPATSLAGRHTTAFYFRTIDDAAAFLSTFTGLKLADDVGERVEKAAPHHGAGWGR